MKLMNAEEMEEVIRKLYAPVRNFTYQSFHGYVLYSNFARYQKEIEDLQVYDDDVWVTSYPKSGTTWTQEMVWCICNDLDFEGAKQNIHERFPFIDFVQIDDGVADLPKFLKPLEMLKEMPRPRFIKTHLPWDLLPKQIRTFEKRPKIIHVARNPKDVCVSYYHHMKMFNVFLGNFEQQWQLFINDKLVSSPFFKNVLSYFDRCDESNILFIKYEDLKKDLGKSVLQVAEFLGVDLSEDQVEKLKEHLSFESMKNNKAVNHTEFIDYVRTANPKCSGGEFIRKGKAGGYKEEMDEEVVKIFDEWIEANLSNTKLRFDC
ncbi:PREDICTED: sulfotransferase family cytosolic 1B member 1-like [Nicrophorus vespilloides]|uniref:Sulfotransferase family cytosolic 1B member 1-like n=1 Tax=Nicrophorus vespilloides TaxID=110193 RepID=A0ABM1N5M3_NICVS|nr:PREDICTED: sulfotransferase family cytosolic 1B member 1-like [Nicrophorus vespilloides]